MQDKIENKELKVLTDIRKIPFDKNFILSGLNLASTGYLTINEITSTDDFFYWPDGIFVHRYFSGLNKIPGRNVIKYIYIPDKIDTIHVIGNLSAHSNSFLKIVYPNKKIKHSELPYGNFEELKKSLPKIYKNELCLITLPTPKQEQIAFHYKDQKEFKIICIGGSVNLASGEESVCPIFLEKLGLEFMWRLKTDTKRRFLRLLKTSFLYFKSEINGSFKKLKLKVIN